MPLVFLTVSAGLTYVPVVQLHLIISASDRQVCVLFLGVGVYSSENDPLTAGAC